MVEPKRFSYHQDARGVDGSSPFTPTSRVCDRFQCFSALLPVGVVLSYPTKWELSSAGRALALHARCRRFEPVSSHQLYYILGYGIMSEFNQLADLLFHLAGSCGVHTTMRRCMHVLRNKSCVTSESAVLSNLTELLLDLKEVPLYTVDGVQKKIWLEGRVLVKLDDSVGQPYGLVEHIVSRALDFCSFMGKPVDHVHYDACSYHGSSGCSCANYLRKDEYETMFWDTPETASLSAVPYKDLLPELAIMFLCDLLFYNPDRHHGNIIVVIGRGTRRLAPIFDMGNSLTFVSEPRYDSFVPDPYGLRQLLWASSVLRAKPVFRVTDFYNKFNHDVPAYPRRLVDAYLERVLMCSEAEYIKQFWEVI